MSELVTRIPAETLSDCNGWSLPNVTSKKIIPSVKKEKRNSVKKAQEKKSDKKKEIKELMNPRVSDPEKEEISDEPLPIEPMTAEKLKNITEDAEKEGFDSGYKDGFEKAKKEGMEEADRESKKILDEHVNNLNKIMDTLLKPLSEEQEVIEKQMVDMICHLTKGIIKRELSIDSSSVIDVVSHSLKLLQNPDKGVVLYLNPNDIDLVKSSITGDVAINYESDESLLPGGCRLENKNTKVDASVDRQLEQILDDFAYKRHQHIEAETDISVEAASEPDDVMDKEE